MTMMKTTMMMMTTRRRRKRLNEIKKKRAAGRVEVLGWKRKSAGVEAEAVLSLNTVLS